MVKNLPVELKGLGKAIIIALVLGIVAAVVVYFTDLQETLLNPLANIVLIISIFYGSCYLSKSHGNKGLLRGMSFGLSFFILMLAATIILNPALIDFKSFIYNLLICMISGILGGIVGVGISGS